MSFWGCILKPGQKQKVDQAEGDILHVSQACLSDPKDGKNYVQAEVNGVKYAIACLEKGKKEHDSFDLFFNVQEANFSVKGNSEVHLTGYFEPDNLDDDLDEDEEEELQEVVKASPRKSPAAPPQKSPVAAAVKSPFAAKAASPKKSPVVAPADFDDSEDEEEEEDLDFDEDEEEEEEAAAAVQQDDSDSLEFEDEEEEEDLDFDEDEESEEEVPPARSSPKVSPKLAAAAAASLEESSDLEDEEEEEDLMSDDDQDLEDEEEEEESDEPPPKKAKVETAPATKSPKTGGGDWMNTPEAAQYIQKLHTFLKSNGAKMDIGLVGSKVPRPKTDGVPKLKAIFEANKAKFTVDQNMVIAK